MIPSNSNIDNRVIQDGIDPVQLVEIDSDTDWYFTTRVLNSGQGAGYDNYDPKIIKIGNIDQRANSKGFGVSNVSDVRIELSNTDPIISNNITADFTSIVNKKVVIKFGFLKTSAGADFPLTSFITIYSGYVRHDQATNKKLILQVVDASFLRHKTIPTAVIRSSDFDVVPPRNVGKAYPATYGTHDHAQGYLVKQSAPQEVFYDRDAQDLKAFNKAFAYISTDETFLEITPNDTGGSALYTVKTNKEGFDFTGAGLNTDGVLTLQINAVPVSVVGTAFTSNPENTIDGSTSTFSENSGDSDDLVQWTWTLPEFPDWVTAIKSIFLYTKVILDGVASRSDDLYSVVLTLNDSSSDLADVLQSDGTANEQEFNNIDGSDNGWAFPLQTDKTFLDVSGADLEGTYLVDGGEPIPAEIMCDLDNFEIYVALVLNTDMNTADYYADLEGRIFGSGWTGKTSTNMVEHPADVINAIYRHELGLVDADIDEDSFDDAITYLSGWKFAGQLLDFKSSRVVIDKLCQQSTLRNYKRNDDTEAVKPRDVSASVDATFDDSNSKYISHKHTSPDNIHNEFRVQYNKNYATGNYESEKFVTASDNNLTTEGTTYETKCSTATSTYGASTPDIIKADFIRDDATAELLLKERADYYSKNHLQIILETAIRDGLLLEQFDVVQLDNPWIPSELRATNGKFEIIGLDPDPLSITYRIEAESLD